MESYSPGNIITMSKRSYSSSLKTEWTKLTTKYCPHFEWKKTIYLNFFSEKLNLTDEEKIWQEEFKFSFSFDNERFITPYFLITDGKGAYLEKLEIIFIYLNGEIKDLEWNTHYNSDDKELLSKKLPKYLEITFSWKKLYERDEKLAMLIIIILHIMIGFSIIFYIIVHSKNELFNFYLEKK
jgi:hypothetical protein